MEDSTKMMVLGGGAAACVALGFLGLQYMGGERIDNDVEQPNNDEKNENATVDEKMKKIKEEVKDEVKEEINLKLYNNIEKEETDKQSIWSSFWKKEYESTIKDE